MFLVDLINKSKKTLFCLLLCFVIDNVCCFILYLTFHTNNEASQNVRDLMVLGPTRTLTISLFLLFALMLGSLDFHWRKSWRLFSCNSSSYSPLSIDNEDNKADVSEQEELIAAKWRKVFIALLFASCTLFQMYIGVKCVILEFSSGGILLVIQASAIVSTVAIINLELFLARKVIADSIAKTGELFPVHIHPLLYKKEVRGSIYCDACSEKITEDVHNCSICDFDLCQSCSEKDQDKLEGQMRNDKGLFVTETFTTWTYIKALLVFVKNYKLIVSVALVFLLASALASVLLPNFQGNILDQAIKADLQAFYKYVILYVVANVCVGLFSSIQHFSVQYVGKKMLYDVQVALFQNMMKQDIAFFDGFSSGTIASRLCYDVDSMISPANQVISTFLSSSTLLLGGLVMCLYTSWRLSVLAFTTIGPITLIYREYAKMAKLANGDTWNHANMANDVVDETVHNIRTIRSFVQESSQEEKYLKSRGLALASDLKNVAFEAITELITSYIEDIISVLILWYGGLLTMDSSSVLSIGSLITFQLYWNLISANFKSLTTTFGSFTTAGGVASQLIQMLACKPAIDPLSGNSCDSINGDIELRDVNFYYQMRPDQTILKNLNLHIKSGQVCAIVGKSGGGKSTIIHMLQRFYDPTEGSIFVDGKDLKSFNPISYRKHIGVVSQNTQLFNDSVLYNITLCKKEEKYTMEEVYEAAKKANAHDFIMEMEDGYYSRVGENGDRLSGGQKQRIALARAFLKQPSLLFLDEATSALDAESESAVQDAIDKLIATRKCTVVLVAHRLSTVVGADQIVVVSNGLIAENGTHTELMHKGGLYAALVSKQTKKYSNLIVEEDD